MLATTIYPGLSINLNLLQTFLLVAEHRSFSEAARRSGRSASAISGQIRQLEEQLSVTLFNRTTRSVELTERGRRFLENVRPALDDLSAGLSKLRDDEGSIVHFACSNSLASSMLPTVLRRIKGRRPGVEIKISEMPSLKMPESVLSGEIAFGIGSVNDVDPRLEFDTFLEDPIVAMIPRAMAQSGLSSITLRELSEMPLLLQIEGSITRQTLIAAMQRAGLCPNIKYQGIRQNTLSAMVGNGLGVAVMASQSCRYQLHQHLRMVPISGTEVNLRIGLIRSKQRKLSPAAGALSRAIKGEFCSLALEPVAHAV